LIISAYASLLRKLARRTVEQEVWLDGKAEKKIFVEIEKSERIR